MQDVHSIGGGRLFGGGDRRLRPHHHQNHQALKCPRCDSLNTKFCYYNNYNLSQPRHFCKSCRRYWTKGGVLRNVPVGGGCRKTKRSKPKSSSSDTTAEPPPPQDRKSLSHSSSESSSLTATTTAAAAATTTTTTEAVSGLSAPSGSSTEKFLNIHDSNHFSVHSGNPNSNPSFESTLLEQGSDNGIFSEIGGFTSLITSSTDSLAFGFSNLSDISGFRLNQQNQWQPQQQQQPKMVGLGGEELKMQQIAGGMIDQTVQAELSALQNRSNGGFGSLDWQASGDHHGLFDLPNAVDQQYWSQSQWASDQDHPSLYLP